MKHIFKTAILALLLTVFSCGEYLDVVPDNVMTLEDIFSRKEQAWEALSKVYSYLPAESTTNGTSWTLGDEWVDQMNLDEAGNNLPGIRIMKGYQSLTNPILGLWSGTGSAPHMYKAIRNTNVFLDNIDNVMDLKDDEKKDWKAQVTFLKGYFHFLLLKHYGPIVISDQLVPSDATAEEFFQFRSKVTDCYDYIIKTMDKAIPDLQEKKIGEEMGQIDKIAALAIKAKVLLFRASPFYNGNREYYADFFDHDGKPFFPQDVKTEYWQDALTAIDEAIALCHLNGLGLYEFDQVPYIYDREDMAINPTLKTIYDLRFMTVAPWNKEIVWGNSNIDLYGQNDIGIASAIRLPKTDDTGKTYAGTVEEASWSWQWLGASYAMLERYYTKNGLPLEADRSINVNMLRVLTTTPKETDPEYDELRGILQPGHDIVRLYMNREPRFYANLGITGGYWRGHAERIPTLMYSGSAGGRQSSTIPNDFLASGIGVQKFVHPESKSGAWQRVIHFPYPNIRMADLYLMKAEILNECDAPLSDVYEQINLVRDRAGIPKVEIAWADADIVQPLSLTYHTTTDGLREIILQERSIELAFEGSYFWDMLRYRRAPLVFASPAYGWDYQGSSAMFFFARIVLQNRKFTIIDCLWPIQLDEMNTNGNLIQNPGY
jgi:hypothetical protein